MLAAPFAVNVTQVGTQPFALDVLMLAVGIGFTITAVFAELLQPFAVPTTVMFCDVVPLNG